MVLLLRRFFCPGFFDARFCAFLRLDLHKVAVYGFQKFLQVLFLTGQFAFSGGFLIDQLLQQGSRFPDRQRAVLCLFHLDAQNVVLVGLDAVDVLFQALADVVAFSFEVPRLALERLLQILIQLGLKNVPEDLLPVLRGREQQAQEIALRDHRDLHELLAVYSHDLMDRAVDVVQLCHDAAVGIAKFGFCDLRDRPLPPQFGPFISRAALYGIGLSRIGKLQLHLRGGAVFRVFGAEHGCVAVLAAGLAVQRERDRVEDRRLARAGIAGDEIQAAVAEIADVQYRLFRVRSERGHRQFQRSHLLSSHTFPIRLFMNADWSSVIDWLFISS